MLRGLRAASAHHLAREGATRARFVPGACGDFAYAEARLLDAGVVSMRMGAQASRETVGKHTRVAWLSSACEALSRVRHGGCFAVVPRETIALARRSEQCRHRKRRTIMPPGSGVRRRIARRIAVPLVGVAACVAAVLVSAKARADVVVYEREEYEPRQSLNLGFDAEGVIPTSTPRFISGNNLSGGSGFKLRIGDQIRFPRMRIIPEGGYAFDHLFATDTLGTSYAWDMNRFFGGIRLTFGRVVAPGFYAHLGYGWRNTGDPTVPQNGGLAFDAGFTLDIHVIRHLGLGAHAEYTSIDAQPYTPQWLALGLHVDLAL